MLLISEDLNIGNDEALTVLQKSQAYGLHQFPDNSEDSEDDNAYRMRMSREAQGKRRKQDVLPQYRPQFFSFDTDAKGKGKVFTVMDEEMISDSDSSFD